MLKIERGIARLLTATAIAALGVATASFAQPPAGGAPGGPGARPAYDYNKSDRTAEDKALQNPFASNNGWYEMPAGRYIGGISGIEIDKKDGKSLWIFERCGGRDMCVGNHVDPIIHFAPDGKIIKMFGKDEVAYPHGLYVDPDNNVWITDLQSNMDPAARRGRPIPSQDGIAPTKKLGATVTKYSPDGKILLTIGTPGVYGNDATHLSQPSDVITDKQGNIYVADSHDSEPSNDRVVKYDKTGKFIKQWEACKPTDKSQIDCAHALAWDSKGQLYVGNRSNDSVDVYTQDGVLVKSITNWGKPSGIFIDDKDNMYVSDSQSGTGNNMKFVKGVRIGALADGKPKWYAPDPLGNMAPWSGGSTLSPEGVTADKDGIMYTSHVTPGGITKWTISKTMKPFPYAPGQ